VALINQNVELGVPLPEEIAAALARLREAIPANFDSAYAMLRTPLFLSS
jgi:hypothetical protein